MPRLPIDYANTIIYKIVCNDLNITECYVGHTTSNHNYSCNNEADKNHNLKVYVTIRSNCGWDNWSMIEIEKYPCKDSNEACSKEKECFEILNSKLNTQYPQRSNEEYREAHREKISIYHKEYKFFNKEEISISKSKTFVCE